MARLLVLAAFTALVTSGMAAASGASDSSGPASGAAGHGAPGAGGAAVQVPPTSIYVIMDGDSESETLFAERMSLPASLALSDWTAFTVSGADIRLAADTAFSQGERRLVSREPVGGVLLLTYAVNAAFAAGARPAARASVTVKFSVGDCLSAKRKVRLQPARLAVSRAIGRSGRAAGLARVVALDYLGMGRFTATVELR